MKNYILSCISLFFAFPVAAETFEKTLGNGLKLIVHEDHRTPTVVSQLWYRVGSNDEREGITGISHALEHMMFKGTSSVKAGEFSRIIAANGGRENAFTGKYYTTYFQRIASNRLEICLELEADRMTNLLLDPTEFQAEIEVIKEERSMRVENSPRARLYEQFIDSAYAGSPLRFPTIGSSVDIEHLELADLSTWYRRWYRPDNATLVVAGDVEVDDVVPLVEKYFAPIVSPDAGVVRPKSDTRIAPAQKIELYAPTALPFFMLGFVVPEISGLDKASDAYALVVLRGILDGGKSARFARQLLRGAQPVATEVSAGYNPFEPVQGLFVLEGTPRREVSITQLQRALIAQIDVLKKSLVTDDELERVKAQIVAARVYGQDSVFYSAMQIGLRDSAGLDWRINDRYLDNIKKVSATDIKRVVLRYLKPERMTTATLWPEEHRP